VFGMTTVLVEKADHRAKNQADLVIGDILELERVLREA